MSGRVRAKLVGELRNPSCVAQALHSRRESGRPCEPVEIRVMGFGRRGRPNHKDVLSRASATMPSPPRRRADPRQVSALCHSVSRRALGTEPASESRVVGPLWLCR
jgi:hypothetical protein